MERAVKVDYLNFTTRRTLAEVIALFSYLENPLKADEKGLYGYSFKMSSSQGVMVLYSAGRDDIHVQLSGRACDREIYNLLELVAPNDHVTRLDVAIDCVGSGYTCSQLWGWLRRGSFASVSSDIRQVEGLLSRKGRVSKVHRGWGDDDSRFQENCDLPSNRQKTRSNSGHTIYIGSSSSDRMVRIYDKGVESGTGADWLRFEVQLRRESANQFFLASLGGGFEQKALALLNRQIRFFADGQESKIANNHLDRCELHPFWVALTDAAAPLKLKIQKALKTVRSTIRYVKNCGSAIKALKGVMPDFAEFFEDVIDGAILKPHHVAMQDDMQAGFSQADSYYNFLQSGYHPV